MEFKRLDVNISTNQYTFIGETVDIVTNDKQITDKMLKQLDDLVLIGIVSGQKSNVKSTTLAEHFKKIDELDKVILHYEFTNKQYVAINQFLLQGTTINHLILYNTKMTSLQFKSLTSLQQFSIIASPSVIYEIDAAKLGLVQAQCQDLWYLRLPDCEDAIRTIITKGIVNTLSADREKNKFKMRIYSEDQYLQTQEFHFAEDKLTIIINSEDENEAFDQFAATRQFRDMLVMLNTNVRDLFCFRYKMVHKLVVLMTHIGYAAVHDRPNPFDHLIQRLMWTRDQLDVDWIELTLHATLIGDNNDVQRLRHGVKVVHEKLPNLEILTLMIVHLHYLGENTTIHSLALDVCNSAVADPLGLSFSCYLRQ